MVGEIREFETLNSLILAEVEVLGILIDLPVLVFSDVPILIALVVSDFSNVTVLSGLSDGALRP